MATRCNDKVTMYVHAELIGMSLHTSKSNYKLSRIQVIFGEPALYRPSPVGNTLVNVLNDINTREMPLPLKPGFPSEILLFIFPRFRLADWMYTYF